MLHVHKDVTDGLDITEIAEEFVSTNTDRMKLTTAQRNASGADFMVNKELEHSHFGHHVVSNSDDATQVTVYSVITCMIK